MQPIYGVVSSEHIPWRLTSGGGRELHFLEDKELEVADLVAQQLPKLPALPSVKSHWLAIEGVQPAIPENPAPVSKHHQKQVMFIANILSCFAVLTFLCFFVCHYLGHHKNIALCNIYFLLELTICSNIDIFIQQFTMVFLPSYLEDIFAHK